ncbi:deoxyguanosinetriphosphate triphosphohydrolase family protein [Romboutsia ilealis]|uniref:deoxyguanosinetriphosphate triphosphohydrolase family protein n=1 Tax=Romboutsia ilealis TaxID=1115758 RepID=UPI002573DCA9|nr:HD domain-containing protein [Romboutsia ilealis]
MKNLFKNYAANQNNPKWEHIIARKSPLYVRDSDIRSEFERDYTRIIHSNSYRRLKHKTQVFFSPENDHICTRIEHVTHVESISYSIAHYLGLNTELTKAIAVSHDLGHSPFGHSGERILSNFSKADLGVPFWHEKNGLDFVDSIELLEDSKRNKQNLNLTYAVRDGIISHCGEIDENGIRPRDQFIDLSDYTHPNQFSPYTWEACIVKIADKISYIGRDIEDAITLGILDNHLDELYELLNYNMKDKMLNNSNIIHCLIDDLCENSSPEKGLCFSDEAYYLINKIKEFNYKNIYFSDRIKPSNRYFELVLSEIYSTLKSCFDGKSAFNSVKSLQKFYPKLYNKFSDFLYSYYDYPDRTSSNFKNMVLFQDSNKSHFYQAILFFISGMTDNYAMEIYNQIVGF